MGRTPAKYTAEFKLRVVHLATQPGMTQMRVAENLGISTQILSRWIKKHKEAQEQGRPVFTGRGVAAVTEQEKRINELEKEVEILRVKREILCGTGSGSTQRTTIIDRCIICQTMCLRS